jgi:type I restriction enzyme S subunit
MSAKRNVPKLRFSRFHEPWTKNSLSEVADFLDGRRVPLSSVERAERKGETPYYGASGIIDYIDDYIFDEELVLLSEDGANILSRTTPVAFLISGKTWVNNHAHVLRAKGNGKFLVEFLELLNYEPYNTGTVQPKLNSEVCKKIPIILPSLPEQQKIASFLTAVDRRIELLLQKKEKLERFKKGVMQQLFTRKIRFKANDGSEFPDWEEAKLGDVAIFLKGKGISKNDISEDGNLECIRYGQLYTEYGEVIDQVKSKTDIDPKNLILSQANDVIIPSSGETQIDIARASCVIRAGIALGGDLNIIRSPINGVFLSYFLNHRCKNEIAKMAQGISVVHLYNSQLQLLQIEVPSAEEQIKIVGFMASLKTTTRTIEKEIKRLQTWKKGLLQQLFV